MIAFLFLVGLLAYIWFPISATVFAVIIAFTLNFWLSVLITYLFYLLVVIIGLCYLKKKRYK
jgi:hypothetical protein